RLRHAIAWAVLIGLGAVAGISNTHGFARVFQRSGASPAAAEVKPHARQGSETGEPAGHAGDFSINPVAPSGVPAAAVNLQLSKDLNWMFGSKAQHGWAIYVPLICREIATDADVQSAEFAQAVARWQRQNGLAPSGIIDSSTWSAMVRDFQSRRIKDRGYPQPDQMVTAPASEFYDPERPQELRQVQRDAYQSYKRMLAAAATDLQLGAPLDGTAASSVASNQYLRIISAFRSREYQDQLRKQSPKSGRAGLAVNSPHFSGRALDLYVGGDPVNTKDENRMLQTATPVYRWL